MAALCVTADRPLYFTSTFFKHVTLINFGLRHHCADLCETLPHDVGPSAIENVFSKFSYVPPKNWGQNPILAIFFTPHQEFVVRNSSVYNADVHSLCVPNLLGSGTYNKAERLSVKLPSTKIRIFEHRLGYNLTFITD